MSKNVIITGGAGYLGSTTAEWLKRNGYHPVAFDNFSTSRKQKFSFPVVEVDLTQPRETLSAFQNQSNVAAVFHFAAFALVSESCEKPGKYFHNNIESAVNVAEACIAQKIPHLVHSSSCAVYGIPERTPIPESHPRRPSSPYGETKVIVEDILNQYSIWKGLKVLHLRYFNPAGSLVDSGLGEAHEPETHLIPRLVEAALHGKPFELYGNDYPTPDGSCIRDLIHVVDLAEAHRLGLEYLQTSKDPNSAINVGLGKGVSVLEAVKAAEKVLEKRIEIKHCPRRPGDPHSLVSATDLATKLLNFRPNKTLADMVHDHWQWRKS